MSNHPAPVPADERAAQLRILDANANRALEGLRVVEEYLRFVLNDAGLAERSKQLRHELGRAVACIPVAERLAARDTAHDVGTGISAPDEYLRKSNHEVAVANQKRTEQALRCLEEFAKPAFPDAARQFESLRYAAYCLARALEATRLGRTDLAAARLYVLVDGAGSSGEFTARCTQLIGAGVHVLQLRDKRLADRELLDRARRLRALTRGTPTRFIMNDRADLAVLADADGVHVGQEELTVDDARRMVGPERLIGVSTHSLEQARQAVWDGANYIGCGPTFPSDTKRFDTFPGCDLLRAVAREISLPAFAIGGIHLGNLAEVQACGFHRIAVSSAVTRAADPALAVQQLLARLLPSSS
ncbi:MAG: thiamine phosphate synthase [Pirellulaceae bacterium]